MNYFPSSLAGFLLGGVASLFWPTVDPAVTPDDVISQTSYFDGAADTGIILTSDPEPDDDIIVDRFAIDECDKTASHPNDRQRMQPGVANNELAIGSAIQHCSEAVEIAPSEPRLHFQYGRVLWEAGRYDEAFDAFVEAAASDPAYAAAEKFIGDAYLEGKGLPPSEQQDVYTALEWYQKSAKSGFNPGEQAVLEVEEYIEKNTFDPTLFKNPDLMQALYDGRVEDIDDPLAMFHMLSGLYDMLDSEQAMDHAPDCKPQLSLFGKMKSNLGAYAGMFTMLTDDRKTAEQRITGVLTGVLLGQFKKDDGTRDAVTLFKQYGCDSEIGKRVIASMEKSEDVIMADVQKFFQQGFK